MTQDADSVRVICPAECTEKFRTPCSPRCPLWPTADHRALIGRLLKAQTLTRSSNACLVEVTAIEVVGPEGIEVWGYRQYPNRARHRQTSYPRRYFIPLNWLPSKEAS